MGNSCCLTNLKFKCLNQNQDQNNSIIKLKTLKLDILDRRQVSKNNENKLLDVNNNNNKPEDLLNSSSLKNIQSYVGNDLIQFIEQKQSLSSNSYMKMDEFKNFENDSNLDFFTFQIIDEINKARTNCEEYSRIINKYHSEINSENNKFYINSYGNKLYFEHGKIKFIDCVDFLSKKKSMKKFIYKEELRFTISDYDKKICTEKDFLVESLKKLKIKFKGKYDIKKFLFYKSTKCPEVSTTIQIVNDFARKENDKHLLNENYKYIGLNYKYKKNGLIGVFLTFAN